jgi:hypothetical protein
MNLQENYRRLFKGRIGSNDSKLIKENANPEVAKAYSAVYSLTDKHGDEPLEVMNQYVDQEGLTNALAKYLDDKKLSTKESKELIAVLNDVAGQFSVTTKTATPKEFDQAIDTKPLKNIKFKGYSPGAVKAMRRKDDPIVIDFNNEPRDEDRLAKIRDIVDKLTNKEKSVAAMDGGVHDNWRLKSEDPKTDPAKITVYFDDVNYAGLTHLLSALDDEYGKSGMNVGWLNPSRVPKKYT